MEILRHQHAANVYTIDPLTLSKVCQYLDRHYRLIQPTLKSPRLKGKAIHLSIPLDQVERGLSMSVRVYKQHKPAIDQTYTAYQFAFHYPSGEHTYLKLPVCKVSARDRRKLKNTILKYYLDKDDYYDTLIQST